jgi:phage terminase small subunit
VAELTPKQARFVEEYLCDLNATRAALRAGYSSRTAGKQGPRLLDVPEVRAAIDAAKGERSDKTQVDAERVLQEIAAMAFYDPAAIMLEIGKANLELADGVSIDDDGKIWGLRGPGDIRRLPDNVRRAIVGWGWDRNQNFTVKLADKSKALDQLARHLSLYNDKLQVQSLDGLAGRLARATARLGK